MISNKFSHLKVALVTDSMLGFGGSDRHLLSIAKLFPNSEIFTSVYDKKKYKNFNINIPIHTSLAQKIPFPKRYLSTLFPFFFEQFNFEGYDLVISLSAGPAKGIITRVLQPQISIILTPPRHLWDKEVNVRGARLRKLYSFFSKILSHYLRIWDMSASKRLINPISISKYIQKKAKRIYGIDSEVIYPGIDNFWFENLTEAEIDEKKKELKYRFNLPDDFVFTVSRLFDHKRIDIAIKASKESNTTLVIAGTGPDRGYLEKIKGKYEKVIFVGDLDDKDIRILHHLSSAFVFCAIEDFGIVPIEAMASGKPVIYFNQGGVTETVLPFKTGIPFNNEKELIDIFSKKEWKGYNPMVIVNQAKQFSEDIFHKKLLKYLNKIYERN